eukprot:scaffold37237_cov14-Tisochrysis_lutea.AAC.1
MHASLLGKSQGGSCRTVQHTSRHQSSSHRKLSKMAAAAGWEQPGRENRSEAHACMQACTCTTQHSTSWPSRITCSLFAADLTSAPSAECLKALKAADVSVMQAVAFDVDSTLFGGTAHSMEFFFPICSCEDESIDELAAYMGVGEQVAAMTARCSAIH